ncbi:MAG: hypothetical protein U5K73_08410 [Halofilum sp. (in: g-proteobacteria)]|nr:hypothetical protein [Halofilum sp. (in: g-proteobacteria)]
MQPVRITLPGRYWDSFIYKGRLYLFGVDGDVKSIDWEPLVKEVAVPKKDKIALICAFLRSDYLYQSDVQTLLRDAEVRKVISTKFERLAQQSLVVTQDHLERHEKGRQDNPCPFPHADLEIYNDKLFVTSSSGVVEATCNKKTKYPISTRPRKRWDGPVLGASASYGSIALAAGTEGLYELDIAPGFVIESEDPCQLSESACRDCGWTYYSVFASSDNSGYMAEFRKERHDGFDFDTRSGYERIFTGVDTAFEIFGSEGFSWGTQDKLCQVASGEIKVAKYEPWAELPEDRILSFGSVPLEAPTGEVVAAGTASFGVVMELENALLILPSAGPAITLPGEPVNWRVFPRSRRYENQLHAIYDDRIEVLSFNHDYLVDQVQKRLGTTVFSGISPGQGGLGEISALL